MTASFPLLFGLLGFSALLAGLLKNGFGIGAGAFITPLLSLFLSPAAAVALMTPILLLTDVDGVRLYWKQWNASLLARLLPATALGTVLGLAWMHTISPELLKRSIGIITILFALYMILLKDRIGAARLEIWNSLPLLLAWGLVAGVIGSLINAAGVVLTMYFILVKEPKNSYIGTLLLLLASMDAIKMAYFVLQGSIASLGWINIAYTLPLVLLGGYFGHKLNGKVPAHKFESILFVLMLAAGAAMLLG